MGCEKMSCVALLLVFLPLRAFTCTTCGETKVQAHGPQSGKDLCGKVPGWVSLKERGEGKPCNRETKTLCAPPKPGRLCRKS